MQAKDIDDALVLAVVNAIKRAKDRWAFISDVETAVPEAPPKVVLAKVRALIKRKLLSGCGCGCRGDLELTDAGKAALR